MVLHASCLRLQGVPPAFALPLALLCCIMAMGWVIGAQAGIVGDMLSGLLKPDVDHGPSFSTAALHPVHLGLPSAPGLLAAVGDFDSDRYNDLFVISEDRRSVDVYLWSHEDYAFRVSEAARIQYANGTAINSVAGADFNYDGRLDLLLSGHHPNGTRFLDIHFGDYSAFRDKRELPPAAGEVLILDANGDLLPDIFGTIASSNARGFWINRHRAASFEITEQRDEETGTLRPLVLQQSATFADVDGDCKADLLVVSSSSNSLLLEVWLNSPSGFVLDKTTPLPKGTIHYTLSDMDGDGTLDVLLAVRDSNNDQILIGHNIQLPLCTHPWDTNCRQATHLCTADPDYFRDLSFISPLVQVSKVNLGTQNFFIDQNYPYGLHVGDINHDGFPDILLPLSGGRVGLWENVRCDDTDCLDYGRSFRPITDGTNALSAISHAHAAFFFDFDENGSLDVIVLTYDDQSKTSRIVGLFNNFQYDAFFLKTLGLNGVCVSWCSTDPKFPHPKPYGVNQAGAVFKFTVTDLNGGKRIRSGTQLSQSGRLSLQTPYIVFGLGRTSDYIQDFAFAVPLQGPSKHYNYWICIIPNSQLVAIPHHPLQPDTWQLELYINPSGLTLWVILAVASSLVALALIISILGWREKQQDEQLKKENEKIFSFTPL